jgi:hypothetical protein
MLIFADFKFITFCKMNDILMTNLLANSLIFFMMTYNIDINE